MSAKNGLAVSFRNRGRLVACCVSVMALAMTAVFASSASAVPPIKETYLALGDSLAFGYSQQLFNENEKTGENPKAFEHGYVDYYWKHLKPVLEGVQKVNNGCPGETTDSMIGNGALAAAFGIPGESPCAYHKAGLPLHHEYGGVSQLENTIGTIAGLSAAGKPVTHLTLNIGANDELHAIGKCEAEVKAEFEATGESKYNPEEPPESGKHPGTPEQAVKNCIVASVPGLFKHIIENVGRILTAIREGEKFGGVNYAGPIIFQAGYDPYGNLCGPPATEKVLIPIETCRAAFKMKEGQKEILEGSRNLAALLTGQEKSNLAEPFAVCFADPLPKFNPANKFEPERLQKWTNMVNFSEFEGKKNGPDIHPTLEGYKKLNGIMVSTCG
jgi:hypothetical protein